MLSTLEGYNDNMLGKFKRPKIKKPKIKAPAVVKKAVAVAKPIAAKAATLPGVKQGIESNKTLFNPLAIVDMAQNIQEKGIKEGLTATANQQAATLMKLSNDPVVKIAAGIIPGGSSVLEAMNQAQAVKEQYDDVKEAIDTSEELKTALTESLTTRTPATIQAAASIDQPIDDLLKYASTPEETAQIKKIKTDFENAKKAKLEKVLKTGIEESKAQAQQAPVVTETVKTVYVEKKQSFLDFLKNIFSGELLGAEPISTEAYMAQITKGHSRDVYKKNTATGKTTLVSKGKAPVVDEVKYTSIETPILAPKQSQQAVVEKPVEAKPVNKTKVILAAGLLIGAVLYVKKTGKARR